MPFWLQIDWKIFTAINSGMSRPWLDPVMKLVSSWQIWWIVAAGLAAAALIRGNRRALHLAVVLALAIGTSDLVAARVLKPFFQRVRPCYESVPMRQPDGCGSRFGFPSNHAANGMAVTTVLALSETGAWAIASLALALLVGFSRIYLGHHYPLDVLGGYAAGALVGFLLVWMIRRANPLYLVTVFFVKSRPNKSPQGAAVDIEMTVEELKEKLDSKADLQILDVRDSVEFEIANLGGRLIPLSELEARYNEVDRLKETVVLCHHGMRSRRAVQFLKSQGFTNVRNLSGGIDRWSAIIDPTLPRY